MSTSTSTSSRVPRPRVRVRVLWVRVRVRVWVVEYWGHEYEYEYSRYEYDYFKFVLNLYSSTSTEYYISGWHWSETGLVIRPRSQTITLHRSGSRLHQTSAAVRWEPINSYTLLYLFFTWSFLVWRSTSFKDLIKIHPWLNDV